MKTFLRILYTLAIAVCIFLMIKNPSPIILIGGIIAIIILLSASIRTLRPKKKETKSPSKKIKLFFRLIILALIGLCIFVIIKNHNTETLLGGVLFILILAWLFRKTVTPRPKEHNTTKNYKQHPDDWEIKHIAKKHADFLITDCSCTVFLSKICIHVTFDTKGNPLWDTTYLENTVRAIKNEVEETYGLPVEISYAYK